MANIELFFQGRLFFFIIEAGTFLCFFSKGPTLSQTYEQRLRLCSQRTVSKWFWTRPGLFTWDLFIYEHLFTRDRYRNGPVPVYFWTNARKSAVCNNTLSTGRPKCVKADRRRLNLSIERSQGPLAR